MLSLFFNILFIAIIFGLIILAIVNKFFSKKILFITISTFTFLLLIIPCIGHSNFLLTYQLKNQLNDLSIENVNFKSDSKAVKEIKNNSNSKFKILSKEKEKYNIYKFIIEINKNKYFIRMINYTEPLRWIPFNDFKINQINKIS